jgi:hypothetical protein
MHPASNRHTDILDECEVERGDKRVLDLLVCSHARSISSLREKVKVEHRLVDAKPRRDSQPGRPRRHVRREEQEIRY